MDPQQLEYARLSGIEYPEEMRTAVVAAKDSVLKIEERRAALEQERTALEGEIQSLISEEASALVDGADSKKSSAKRKKAGERVGEIGLMLSEIEKLQAAAQAQMREGEESIASYVNDRLAEGRLLVKRQLDIAMTERGRALGHTALPHSTPPESNSKSRIAACEVCQRDIAIFDPRTISSLWVLPI